MLDVEGSESLGEVNLRTKIYQVCRKMPFPFMAKYVCICVFRVKVERENTKVLLDRNE